MSLNPLLPLKSLADPFYFSSLQNPWLPSLLSVLLHDFTASPIQVLQLLTTESTSKVHILYIFVLFSY